MIKAIIIGIFAIAVIGAFVVPFIQQRLAIKAVKEANKAARRNGRH